VDQVEILDAVKVTALNRISHSKGDVLHFIKSNDPCFVGFGEAYFSFVHPGEVKGWKKHLLMTMNVVVPIGGVRFFIYDQGRRASWDYYVGENNYVRLTIPPCYWVAFEGVGDKTNLVLNLSDIQHDPTEALTAPLSQFPLKKL
jgi:dTDP-4-dehydrorhamnose 3,5-epimerase